MFASDTTFDEQSGLLRNGKRYKRDFDPSPLGQATASTPVNPEESENHPVTPQCHSATPEIPSQSESKPGPSIPAIGQSAPINSPPSTSCLPQPPPETPWPTSLMTLNSPSLKARDQRTQNSSGFYVKRYGTRRKLQIRMCAPHSSLLLFGTGL